MATNRVTGVGVEALVDSPAPNARVTGVGVEVLRSITDAAPPDVDLAASLSDEAVLTAELTVVPPAVTQSYTNLGGSGPRRSVWKLTNTFPIAAGSSSRPIECLIDGLITSTNKPYMTASAAAANNTLEFELLGLPRIITGFKWYQSDTIPPLVVAFEGWNGSTWDTLSTDTLNSQGAGGSTPYVASFANTTAYQKYRFREDSGNWGTGTPIWQIEFEISGTGDEFGDRQSTITATTTLLTSRSPSNFVDGAYALTTVDSWWPNAQSVAGLEIKFQFATPRVVKYARSECMSYTGGQGVWKWQGSNDGSSWTDIGSSFTWNMTNLTVGAGETPVHDLSSNTTAYSYYRLLGISGSVTTAPYWQEMYFDIDASEAADVNLAVAFEDEAALTALLTVMSPSVDLSASFVDEAVFTAALTVGAGIDPVHLQAAFVDEALFTANLTNIPPPVNLAVSFTDSAVLKLKPLKIIKPVHLAASLTDEAKFTAAIFMGTETPGPFYFAWASEGDKTFNSSFLREDEDVLSFELSQKEGDFASLRLVIKNPRVGLLGPSRKVWCWLSYFDGSVPKPLFFGRLTALPSNIFDTLVTLDFVARPNNFAAQKEALAHQLRVAPYFDPLFISPDHWDDPDVVLEARSALWHIDRVTHELTISDVIVPEDGVVELTEDDHLYDGLSTSMSGVPARRVRIEASIPWTLKASGVIDLKKRLLNIWESPRSLGAYSKGLVSSYTFDGLSGDWPSPGKTLSSGWVVTEGSLINTAGLAVPSVDLENLLKYNSLPSTDADKGQSYPAGTAVFRDGDPAVYGTSKQVTVPIGWGIPVLKVTYQAVRDYSESVVIDLEADMQAIMTMPGDEESVVIRINANSASDVTRDGTIPQANISSSTFASSARGKKAIEHLILHARAALINRSRAVTVGCVFKDFLQALDITLRQSLLIHDHRLPDGQVLGKVTEYNLSYSNGRPIASVTIQSAVGYGGAVTEDDGEDMYIDDSYIADYYVHEGHIVALPASDVSYEVPVYGPNDDGINFMRGLNADSAVRSIVVSGGPLTQQQALNDYVGTSADIESVKIVLQALPTQVHMDMLPIGGGPYTTEVPVVVSTLKIPKQIDLEAT